MDIDCPKCEYTNEDVGEYLPKLACDDVEYECVHCEHKFLIGWVAEIELR